jgi:hypothetical protein
VFKRYVVFGVRFENVTRANDGSDHGLEMVTQPAVLVDDGAAAINCGTMLVAIVGAPSAFVNGRICVPRPGMFT